MAEAPDRGTRGKTWAAKERNRHAQDVAARPTEINGVGEQGEDARAEFATAQVRYIRSISSAVKAFRAASGVVAREIVVSQTQDHPWSAEDLNKIRKVFFDLEKAANDIIQAEVTRVEKAELRLAKKYLPKLSSLPDEKSIGNIIRASFDDLYGDTMMMPRQPDGEAREFRLADLYGDASNAATVAYKGQEVLLGHRGTALRGR